MHTTDYTTVAGITGQLPDGLEPGRPGPGENRADYGALRARDASLVPELPRAPEEAATTTHRKSFQSGINDVTEDGDGR